MKPLEERMGEVLFLPQHSPDWLNQASILIGDVAMLRRAFQRMHRRAQRAEAMAHREGQRADSLARNLRRSLTASAVISNMP